MGKCIICNNGRNLKYFITDTLGFCSTCWENTCPICLKPHKGLQTPMKFNGGVYFICKTCQDSLNMCECGMAYMRDGETEVCPRCASMLEKCQNCGRRLTTDAYTFNSPKGSCCVKPYKKKEYNYRPEIFTYNGDLNESLMFGLEFEYPLPHGIVEERWVNEFMKQFGKDPEKRLYVKHDGSIGGGFEVVFQPHTYEALLDFPWERFKEFGDVLNLEKYMGWHSNIGMHIHLDKGAFSKLQLFKFSQFLIQNHKLVTYIGERELNGYCGAFNGFLAESIKRGEGSHLERYSLVNLANKATVELRFFKSTTDPNKIWKAIQFAKTLYLFTKEAGLRNWKVGNYLKFCRKFSVEHKNDREAIPQLMGFLENYVPTGDEPPSFGGYVKKGAKWKIKKGIIGGDNGGDDWWDAFLRQNYPQYLTERAQPLEQTFIWDTATTTIRPVPRPGGTV